MIASEYGDRDGHGGGADGAAVEGRLRAACDCDCGGGGTWRDNVSDLASFVKYILMWREIESRRWRRL